MSTPQAFSEFEAAERQRGCSEVVVRSWDPGTELDTHTHPFRARALVVEGEMWLTSDGVTRHLQPGDRFDVAAGQPHAERYGPHGATYWVARSGA
jgi:quercetin dioxygenase-like cupin family protein